MAREKKADAGRTASPKTAAAPPQVRVSVGSHRFLVDGKAFRRWERALQDAAGFKPADGLAEIRRRLGL